MHSMIQQYYAIKREGADKKNVDEASVDQSLSIVYSL